MSKLGIIYRACSGETGDKPKKAVRPPWFNKLDCWDQFYREFGHREDTDIYVVYDTPAGEENGELIDHIKRDKVKQFNFIHECNDRGSLIYCINKLGEVYKDYTYLGMQEDDFIFLKNAGNFALDALNLGYSPLTLADHIDRYNFDTTSGLYVGGGDWSLGHEMIGLTNYSHVRTVESTMHSYMYHSKFYLTLRELQLRFAPNDRAFWRELLKNNVRLWGPVPTMSLHVNLPFPPLFNR